MDLRAGREGLLVPHPYAGMTRIRFEGLPRRPDAKDRAGGCLSLLDEAPLGTGRSLEDHRAVCQRRG